MSREVVPRYPDRMANVRGSWSGLLAAAGFLAGCGGGGEVAMSGGTTSGGGAGGATSASSSGTGGALAEVSGTCVTQWFLADGSIVDRPVDLSAGIQAQVLEGTQWVTFPGTGAADGSFVIPGVPAGPYLIGVNGSGGYLYTSERTLDLGWDRSGRPDAVPATSPTEIAGNITGLAPWSSADQIDWISPNTRGLAWGTSDPPLSQGATVLDGSFPYTGGLVDGSKGDVLHAVQYAPTSAASTSYTTIARFASFAGLEQTDAASLGVTGTFSEPPADQTLAVDFRGSQFEAVALAGNPTAVAGDTSVGINAQASDAGPVANLFALSPQTGGDVNLGEVSYANPFPAAWGQVFSVQVTASASYAVAGASPVLLGAGVVMTVPVEQAGAGPIVPLVGQVQEPRINGEDAFGTLSGISLPVTLTWKPPSIGTATGYRVDVIALSVVGGVTTVGGGGASISTTETSLTLPPEMVGPGLTYVFGITAWATANDIGKQPFRPVGVQAWASLVTSAVTL